jgi:hypothetical protein
MKLTNKFGPALVALFMVATTGSSASALDWDDLKIFWGNVGVGFHRNNAWPDPFNEVDAAEVATPFEIMKVNGWRMHNTIGHELFRDGDGALLASGHRRVHWIATQAPTARRTVYVLSGTTRDETEARVASVRDTLSSLYLAGPAPRVLVTDVEPAVASGAWATKINREWLEHLAAPRLPNTSASGSQGVGTPTTN